MPDPTTPTGDAASSLLDIALLAIGAHREHELYHVTKQDLRRCVREVAAAVRRATPPQPDAAMRAALAAKVAQQRTLVENRQAYAYAEKQRADRLAAEVAKYQMDCPKGCGPMEATRIRFHCRMCMVDTIRDEQMALRKELGEAKGLLAKARAWMAPIDPEEVAEAARIDAFLGRRAGDG